MNAKRQPSSRPAVFLDRDGTINRNVGYLADSAGIELLPRAAEAVRRVNELGFWAILVTNQSAIARGLATEEQVRRVNAEVSLQIAREAGARLDGVYYSPYHEAYDHPHFEHVKSWRKPLPGMFLEGAREFDVDLSRSWLVGDGLIDHQAAKAADERITTILLPSRYHDSKGHADYYAPTLWDAVGIIAAAVKDYHPALAPSE